MRDELFRSAAAFEIRSAGDGMPVMTVKFAPFNEWTEIRSLVEGHFYERFARGAFKKTIAEQRDQIRSLFQHGQDPTIGKKPLGPIIDIREEQDGAYADVQLLDTEYVRELLPGLQNGLYGASFMFKPTRVDENKRPARSAQNPDGIAEVTVTEARLREVGPVTWGQYASASASVRSLTDDMVIERLALTDPDRLRAFLERDNTSSDRAPDVESTPDERQAPDVESTPALSIARRRLQLMESRHGAPGQAHPPR